METKGEVLLVGVDPGPKNIGICEYDISYSFSKGSFTYVIREVEYYTLQLHVGRGWDINYRLWYLHNFFSKTWPRTNSDKRTRVLFIEKVPYMKNPTVYSQLIKFTAAIEIAMFTNGFALNEINVTIWKKELLHDGNARKEKVMDWIFGGWIPAQIDSDTVTEDSADAICIGWAGVLRTMAQLEIDYKHSRPSRFNTL